MRRLHRLTVLVAVLFGSLALSSCSERGAAAPPDDLVHRVLPAQSEIPGKWNARTFEDFDGRSGRPGEMSNSESCQEADGLFGEHEGERNLTGIGFASREMAGTYLYFFAEEAPSEWWTPSYSESVAAYYASSAWGRCYADWLEDNQKSSAASVAELQVKASAIAPADGASVAWNYHLEGKPTELRVEVYVWTEGPLMLLVQVFTSEGDLDPDFTATMLSMYRDRATTEIAESR